MKERLIVLDCETNPIEGLLKNCITDLYMVSYAYRNDKGEVISGVYSLKMKRERGSKPHTHPLLTYLTNTESSGAMWVPCFHNAAFDLEVLEMFGFPTPKVYHDTMVAAWCLEPNAVPIKVTPGKPPSKYSLKALGKRYQLKNQKFDAPDFTEYSRDMEIYSEQDAKSQLELAETVLPMLQEDAKAYRLYQEIEIPFIDVIRSLGRTGFTLDVPKLESLTAELEEKKGMLLGEMQYMVGEVPGKKSLRVRKLPEDDIVQEIGCYKYLGIQIDPKDGRNKFAYQQWEAFNPNSTTHKRHALKTLHGFTSDKKSKKGGECLDKGVLKGLDYPLARKLGEYTAYNKLLTTYCHKMLAADGFISCQWNHTGTVTGRMSSSQPNFQNMPARGDWGKKIRGCIVAKPGHKLVSVDLSQIELRVLAWFQVKTFYDELDDYPDAVILWNAFQADEDPHQAKSEKLGIDRSTTKILTYGDLYGFGAAKCAEMLGCSLDTARELLTSWRGTQPSILELKHRVWDTARHNNGVIHTLYGRRLVYPDIMLPAIPWRERLNDNLTLWNGEYLTNQEVMERRAEAERQIFNALIQGTAADIIKILTLRALPKMVELDAELLAVVHDEDMSDVEEEKAQQLKLEMNKVFNMNAEESLLPGLPIKGEAKVGDSWEEIH